MDRESYRSDFMTPESQNDFDNLLRQATVDVVGPMESRGAAYELAGRAIVDRSDIIIVVWNGEPSRGRGSTADLYAYAKGRKPIFWIRLDSGSAELTHWPSDRETSLVPLTAQALKRLDRYNHEHLRASIFTDTPRMLSNQQLLTDPSASTDDSITRTAALLAQHFGHYLVRADALTRRFQRRWFWVARLVYALTALAVAIVAAQILYAPGRDQYAWFEFASLACVTIVVYLAPFDHYRDQWVSAGNFAERIRSLMLVGLAGADIPLAGARIPLAGVDISGDLPLVLDAEADLIRETSWTDRAIAEVWWSRPRYDQTDDVDALRRTLSEEWDDQLRYHRKARRMMIKRSRWFTIATTTLFTLSVVAALLHSLGVGPEIVPPATPWDYLSIVIPAIGAAILGYAAQRHYERRAERELRLAVNLIDAQNQLKAASDIDGIRNVVSNTTRLIRSETSDWYSIAQSQHLDV